MRTKGKWRMKGLVAALGGTALALAVFAPASFAQITNSKHNLGTTTSTGVTRSTFSGTTEICVFCHTPHGSNETASAPLWNKALPDGSSFTMYTVANTKSASLDGNVASAVGSVSLACLSCHDGSLAIATMINQPGSGGYNPAGAVMAGTWTSDSGNVDTTTGQMATGVITNLGKNLVNDHPIGIGYCGITGVPAGTELTGGAGGTCNDKDFNTAKKNTAGIWWVDTNNDDTKTKDELALYTRTGDDIPRVEYGSCHDPHNTANGTFLRKSNAGSGVCLTCHNK